MDSQHQLIHNFFQAEQQRKEGEERLESHREKEEKSAQQVFSQSQARANSRKETAEKVASDTLSNTLNQAKSNLSGIKNRAGAKRQDETQTLENDTQSVFKRGEEWLQEVEQKQSEALRQLGVVQLTHLTAQNVQPTPPADADTLNPTQMLERSKNTVSQVASDLGREVTNLIALRDRRSFRRKLIFVSAVAIAVALIAAIFLYKEYSTIFAVVSAVAIPAALITGIFLYNEHSKGQLYISAKTLLDGGEYLQAREQFQALLNRDSDYRDTMVLLSNSLASFSKYRQKDGMKMVYIPAGTFIMGSYYGDGDEKPVHEVNTDAFYMDKHEVTNEQYCIFLNDYGKNTDAAGHKLLKIGSEYCLIEKVGNTYKPKSGYEKHPVIEVSWYGAAAYAQWAGVRLPTEAQWEKAARGGLVGKKYPWGDTITHDYANYSGTGGRDKWERTSPVGSFPPNGYGLFDMAGNVWEWCAEEYDPGNYIKSPKNNPKGPGISVTFGNNNFTTVNASCVLRGGSWRYYLPLNLRCACRGRQFALVADSHIGFRCSVRF